MSIFKLYPHQLEAAKNLEKLYERHRSAGAMMPTGTGKSFLSMIQILAAKNNPNFHGISEDGTINFDIPENGVINDANIYYLSPTNDIAYQIQKDIAEFILNISEDEINNDLEKIVSKAFPHLHFICYQGLDSKNLEAELEPKNGKDFVNVDTATPDLVIADEVHRSGAPTFIHFIERLLGFQSKKRLLGFQRKNDNDSEEIPTWNPNAPEGKKNIRFFATSATPERDVDGRDMTKYWNELIGGYSEEELDDKVRADLGINLNLKEAVEKGIVVPPNIVHFDANLVDTKQYQDLVEQTTNFKISPSLRAEFLAEVTRINEEIFGEGNGNFHLLSPDDQEKMKLELNAKVLAEKIKDGTFPLDGKYIHFSPDRRNAETGEVLEEGLEEVLEEGSVNENNPIMKHLQTQYEEISKLIELALKKAGKSPIDVNEYYLSSQGQAANTNKTTLRNFDTLDVEEKPGLHVITATQKLDEGVHIARLTGAFMRKPIEQAKEKIYLRGQSIRFLQEVGRCMVAGDKKAKVLFDLCCNVFRQSVEKLLDQEQKIEAFELDPNEKILAETHERMFKKIPQRGQLDENYSGLLKILDVLRQYKSPLNANLIKSNIDDILKLDEFKKHKDEIIAQLDERGVTEEELKKLSSKLKKARQLLSKGNLGFSTFNIKELEELGILDRGSEEFEQSDFHIDENGFVDDAPSGLEHLIHQNINTGTLYGPDGKDIFGHEQNQFDPITGLDIEGYNIEGFNRQGIHRITGFIHDEHGFMADGKNILTGTEYDLAGFNSKGYKPFDITDIDPENGKKIPVVDVVLDRAGKFHKVFDPQTENEQISLKGDKSYKLKNGLSIDRNGFYAKSTDNYFTIISGIGQTNLLYRYVEIQENGRKETVCVAYDRNGNVYQGKNFIPVYDKKSGEPLKYSTITGLDVDGYDKNGFDVNGVHKSTGTRYALESFHLTRDEANSDKVQQELLELHYLEILNNAFKDEECPEGFNKDGINKTTNGYFDLYGFTMSDYLEPEKSINEFGFTVKEVPEHVKCDFKTDFDSKNYKSYTLNGKEYYINIFGCDKEGINIKTGEKDASFAIFDDYVSECLTGNITPEEYINQYAIQHRMLVPEAQALIFASLNKAITLYRLCPGLAKQDKFIDKIKEISKQPEEKITKALFDKCPDLEPTFKTDIKDIQKKLEKIEYKLKDSKDNPAKVASLKRTRESLKRELEALQSLHILEER